MDSVFVSLFALVFSVAHISKLGRTAQMFGAYKTTLANRPKG